MALKVNDISPAAQAMCDSIDKVNTLTGGTKAMRAAGQKYLPKFPLEKDQAYDRRLKTSTLFNAFGHTLQNLAGKPFIEPVKVSDGTDATFVDWFENIDLMGNDLQNFAHSVFYAALRDGQTHVLVDFPVTKTQDGEQVVLTKADEKTLGVRPYVVKIEQCQVLGWISTTRNGAEVLEQFRYMEHVEESDGGSFGTQCVKQVRVLYPGRWEKYRFNDQAAEWQLYDDGTTTLSEIPLLTFYTKQTGFMTSCPPLEDLADLNIKHWQSSSDQDSLLQTARVPLLVRTGVNDDPDGPQQIGKSITDLPAGADMKYVEHSGAAIGAGRESLQDLEQQMEAVGAELLVKKPGTKTATQTAVETSEQQCQLAQMVENFEDFLESVAGQMGRWVGLEFNGEIEVFHDFATISLNAATVGPFVTAMVSLVTQGVIDKQTAFAELKRYGVLDPELVWADVQARLATEAPNLLIPPAAPVKPQPPQDE